MSAADAMISSNDLTELVAGLLSLKRDLRRRPDDPYFVNCVQHTNETSGDVPDCDSGAARREGSTPFILPK